MKRLSFIRLALVLGSIVAVQPVLGVDGDIEAGRAKSATCTACHGADGNSVSPDFPKLAGQGQRYIVEQLQAMKSGVRPVPLMAGFLVNMSEQDMADLGAFYQSQEPKIGTADPALVEIGEVLYRGGDASRGIPACSSCHGAEGSGMPAAGFPALAGQHAKYTQAQLNAYRAVGRGDENGPYRETGGDTKIMQDVAKNLRDAEIKAVASYIQGLHSPD